MATRVIDDTKLQNIAVAIQGKDSGGTMTVDEMPARIAAIPTQGSTALDSLISGNITSVESDVTIVKSYAFSYCSSLRNIVLPNATNISTYNFTDVPLLENLEIPKVNNVRSHTFDNIAVSRLFLQSVVQIGSSRNFVNCSNLNTIIMGKRASLGSTNALSGADNAIIYVQPNDLSWYSTATNWSTLYANNRIKSVSELTGDDLTWYQQQLAKYPEEE